MSVKKPLPPVAEQSAKPTAEQVQEHLVKAFGKLFTYDEVMNNRRRCFATIINYKSPKTNVAVADIITPDEVGEVLDRIRDAKVSSIIGDAGF